MKMKKKFRGVYDEKGERRSKQEEAEVARRPAVVMRHGRLSYNVRMATITVYHLALCVCLAALERSSSGDFGYETGGALGAGGGQRSEDLPGSRAFWGFVTT